MQRKHRRQYAKKLTQFTEQALFEEACCHKEWLKAVAPVVSDQGKKAPIKRHRVALDLVKAEASRRGMH